MNRARDHLSDEELVEVCNCGSAEEAERAFETLYRRHRDYVLRVALRFVRDRDAALDVLQETFTYLLRKFPPTGDGLVLTARLQTLLYPVAKNCAITVLRKADRHARTDSEWHRDGESGGSGRSRGFAGSGGFGDSPAFRSSGPDPDELPAECVEPESGVIDAALAGLAAERREVLTLRFVDGLSLAEIASTLHVPVGTVKSRLHLAIKQLRDDPAIKDLFEP